MNNQEKITTQSCRLKVHSKFGNNSIVSCKFFHRYSLLFFSFFCFLFVCEFVFWNKIYIFWYTSMWSGKWLKKVVWFLETKLLFFFSLKQRQKLKQNHWQLKSKQKNAEGNLKPSTFFYSLHSLNHYVLFFLKDNLFFHLLFWSKAKAYIFIFGFKVLMYYLVIVLIVIRRK